VLKKTVGIRVSAEEEMEGMDLSEHGVGAYNELIAPGQSYSFNFEQALGKPVLISDSDAG
jgi:hypothetical protein